VLPALIISNLVLWIAVIALAAVVFALLRQVGILHERVAPAGALMRSAGPQVGDAAPVFDLTDWSGRALHIGDADAASKSTLLLFVSPTCPVCKTMLTIAKSLARAERGWLRLILASDGTPAEHEAFVREHGLEQFGYVLSTELGLAYQVAKLPHAVLLDATGVIRAKGLVNTREHLESLIEAKERGVASVQEYVQRERSTRHVASA